MKLLKWQTDEDGMLQGLALHDGMLTGLITRNTSLYLLSQNTNGINILIHAKDVSYTNVMNFWQGNIIGDIWLWEKPVAPVVMWKKLFQGHRTEDPLLHSLIEQTKCNYLLALESSYGAEVMVSCNSIEILGYDSLTELLWYLEKS